MSQMRAGVDFKEKVPEIEADIAIYEDSVNLSSGIEAATEAGPQFFFQTVYLLPNLILILVRFQGWQELVSWKMFSIAFSFTSVGLSNYFIRYLYNSIEIILDENDCFIRNRDKKGALSGVSASVLLGQIFIILMF